MSRRARLDAELVRRGLAPTRMQAQRLVGAGRVTVDGAPVMKPSSQVAPEQTLRIEAGPPEFASRAGHKLAGALDVFDVPVPGRYCLDAGASTGGFTDVLLRRGAARVVAVDVGYGQLRWELRTDPRVVVLDRTNVRHLRPEQLPAPPADLVVADLSFISLRLVAPPLAAAAAPNADHLWLVKPQFELGPERVPRGGVVREPQGWRDAMLGAIDAGAAGGLGLAGVTCSPLPGPAGNIEFFIHLRASLGQAGRQLEPGAMSRAIEAAVEAGYQLQESAATGR